MLEVASLLVRPIKATKTCLAHRFQILLWKGLFFSCMSARVVCIVNPADCDAVCLVYSSENIYMLTDLPFKKGAAVASVRPCVKLGGVPVLLISVVLNLYLSKNHT